MLAESQRANQSQEIEHPGSAPTSERNSPPPPESAQYEDDAAADTLDADEELKLQYRWALYYSPPKSKDKEKKWDEARLKKVVEFGTVREFWRVFNNLTPPSTLKEGADLHLFRGGVRPEWEDSFNQKGGTWTYRVSKDDTSQKLDTCWCNTVLNMIGDQFDDADDICGIVVSVRAGTNRVALWIKHADDKDAVKRIGKQFKDINRIKTRIFFYSHDDAKNFSKPNKSSEMIL
jgi:translation initiation factor 4E